MRVVHVTATRPNLVKMAPVIAALRRRLPGSATRIVHTGQHYDRAMSAIFFEELGVPAPDYVLGVGSGSHAEQIARVLDRLAPVLREERPDLVIVPGDVNSTLGAALCAAKLGAAVAHVESGLRSFDRSMPEESNRIVAGYLLVTLHRPALVDGPLLFDAMERLSEVGREMPVVFPVHPRTRKMLGCRSDPGVTLADPVGYLDFLSLETDAAAVLTDSGGIQEETTYLGIPCFTLRDNTERPVTVRAGTNTVLGLAPERIAEIPSLLGDAIQFERPPLWDGRA